MSALVGFGFVARRQDGGYLRRRTVIVMLPNPTMSPAACGAKRCAIRKLDKVSIPRQSWSFNSVSRSKRLLGR